MHYSGFDVNWMNRALELHQVATSYGHNEAERSIAEEKGCM